MRQITIYEILEHLEARTGMYLGPNYNFKSLDSFVTGFTIAASIKQLQHEKYPDFNLFSIWLLGHLKKNFGLSAGWYWQIKNRNPKNDEKAFKEFFIFLNNFKKARLKTKSLVLGKDSVEYNRINSNTFRVVKGKQIRLRTRPVGITCTSFSNSTTVSLDYFDKKGKVIGGFWEINEKKASKCLKREFGELKGKWTKVA
jgi:hypothetical protein